MKRCMIVDDSSVIRKVAKRILATPDMAVVEAGDGHEALALCAAEMPEIIVVDSVLQDMDTVDFIRTAIAMPAAQKPHIMVCMSEFDIGAIMRAKRAGARGYILKPFNRPILQERFREIAMAA